jgi:hypothetical protein
MPGVENMEENGRLSINYVIRVSHSLVSQDLPQAAIAVAELSLLKSKPHTQTSFRFDVVYDT